VRISVVTVREFDDVEQVGARFRNDQPVVIDLRLADTTVARRVLDFVSGMTYAMRGRLTGAGNRTFLLTPDGVELTPEERRRIEDLALRGEA
jgi:cell division inhibitor SepF